MNQEEYTVYSHRLIGSLGKRQNHINSVNLLRLIGPTHLFRLIGSKWTGPDVTLLSGVYCIIVYNLLASKLRNKSELPELVQLLIAFEEMRKEDPASIAHVRVTNSKVLHSVFWASGTQIQNLQQFGDITIFDATYKTNLLDLPLAPLLVWIISENYCFRIFSYIG